MARHHLSEQNLRSHTPLRAHRWICLSLIGILCVAGPANLARALTVGTWSMNEPAGTIQMFDSSVPGHHSLTFSGVVADGTKYAFAGWTSNVDATGRLTGVLANPSLGEIRVPDPAGVLSPWGGSFSVAVSLRPTLLNGNLPLPGTGSLACRPTTFCNADGQPTPVVSTNSNSSVSAPSWERCTAG